MVNNALFMGWYICQSQAYQGTFAIYTKEDILETCAVLEVWYPTRRASHFRWGRAYRALHIGIELEDDVVMSNAVVGEYKSLCRLKWEG